MQENPAFVRPNEIPRLRGSHALLQKLVSKVPKTPFVDMLSTMFHDAGNGSRAEVHSLNDALSQAETD